MNEKLIPLLIIGLLIFAGIGVVGISDGESNRSIFLLSFSNLNVVEDNDFIKFELEGANSLFIKKDYYIVPMFLETFTFPFGTKIINIQCIPKNIQQQNLKKELNIGPKPILFNQKNFNNQAKSNVTPIAINSWYEYDVGTGINKNQRCIYVKFQLFPIQYKPLEKSIEWAKNFEIVIEYKQPTSYLSYDDEYSLIVLAPVDFREELEGLISHKNSRGISTKLITLDDIYTGFYFPVEGRDNPEKIKYFIKNAIENWGINNVLLVGSSFLFPYRKTHVNVYDIDKEVFISDLYYADIYNDDNNFCSWDSNRNNIYGEFMWGNSKETDDVDLYPDVNIGRLACISSDEVIVCVNKIINYETTNAFMQDWFNNLIVCGGDTFTKFYGDGSGIDEGEVINEEIIRIMNGFYPERLWASNGKLYGENGVVNISNIINNGAGFIDFSGHGNTDKWKTHPHNSSPDIWLPQPTGYFKNTDIANLTNGDKLPIIINSACSTSQFDLDSKCFGWTFVSNPDGGGIGSFGPTGLAWGYMGEMITSGLIEGLVLKTFEAYQNDSVITFGEMWSHAISSYIFPTMEGIDYKTVEEWQPFGDPTLTISAFSLAPEKPELPEGPSSGSINVEYTYSSSTTDPDGDQIFYMFDWGDGTNSKWLGPYNSGETVNARHKWLVIGNYNVRVKAKDIHLNQSDWSEPASVLIKDEIPPEINIVKPLNAFYLFNLKIRRYLFRKPFIVGRIEIVVNTKDLESGVNYVEFYVDDNLMYKDTLYPYSWMWSDITFGIKTIKVLCYDNVGNSAFDEMVVRKFF
ncbi:MAG: hypothetical protein JSV67_04940 [Thermoplasmatales archaeon]|nr:MAG: hypothetical protein JSV67_04940 [Thermoplasmatales archaeon]